MTAARRRRAWWSTGLILLAATAAAACGVAPRTDPVATSTPPLLTSPAPSTAAPTPTVTRTAVPSPTASTTPRPSTRSTPTPTGVPRALSLDGDRRNAFAFAPLDDPTDATVEGRVSSTQAWSTSKVLIVAAYLDTVVDGDPDRLTARNRGLIRAALRESDVVAVTTIRDLIPGRSGRAMTAVLRSIGDTTTMAPDSYQGLMPWSPREQVRFMAAMANGRLVSREASAYLLSEMQPIPGQRWGLGTIGATAYKGGWLRSNTVTRQLGVVDGYAVAIITDGVGPTVRQNDGEAAHVRQLNKLAAQLEKRLAYEEGRR